MKVRKFAAGAVFVGIVTAGMFSAGTASAGAGISIDPGTDGKGTIGLGDQTKTGAYAQATEGNTAFAVSVLAPASATVGGNASGSTAGAIGISSPTTSAITGTVKGGGAYTVDGSTKMAGNANGTQVYNIYSNVGVSGPAGSTTTLAFCGTELTAQADHVKVSTGCS